MAAFDDAAFSTDAFSDQSFDLPAAVASAAASSAVYRPIVPLTSENSVEHRRQLAVRTNASFPKDGTEGMTAPLILMSYTVATLPDASLWTNTVIFVSDETGGAVTAFSDGTDWRRTTDRAVVS